MKVLVTGSSKAFKSETIYKALNTLHKDQGIHLVFITNDNGYAYLASVWASDNKVPTRLFLPVRSEDCRKVNQRMIDAKPDLVLAFPGEIPTIDLVTRATKTKIPVIEIEG